MQQSDVCFKCGQQSPPVSIIVKFHSMLSELGLLHVHEYFRNSRRF